MDKLMAKIGCGKWLKLCVLVSALVIVTLNCAIFSGDSANKNDDTKATQIALGVALTKTAQAPIAAPTEAPPATLPSVETPQASPTDIVLPEGDVFSLINPDASSPGDTYYAEDFEGMEGWWVFSMHGDPNGWGYEVFDNRLRAEIVSQDTWVYYMFEDAGNFQDVRIDITVENRASNTNFVGIICRSSDQGWYEANILNTWEYFIYYGYPDEGTVALMHKGGTYAIKTGRSVNSYALTCDGEALILEINGREEFSMPLKTGDFRFLSEGQVGLSVSTSYAIPVRVDFLKFVMSVP